MTRHSTSIPRPSVNKRLRRAVSDTSSLQKNGGGSFLLRGSGQGTAQSDVSLPGMTGGASLVRTSQNFLERALSVGRWNGSSVPEKDDTEPYGGGFHDLNDFIDEWDR